MVWTRKKLFNSPRSSGFPPEDQLKVNGFEDLSEPDLDKDRWVWSDLTSLGALQILNVIRSGICSMIDAFLTQVELVEKHKRVLKVTSKETSEDKAARPKPWRLRSQPPVLSSKE